MENAIAHLRGLYDQLAVELKGVQPTDHEKLSRLIGLRNELNLACKRLELCERWGILPKSIIQVLPPQKCRTPSSEYRIMEDCETENRQYWQEANFSGGNNRFNEGDLIIRL